MATDPRKLASTKRSRATKTQQLGMSESAAKTKLTNELLFSSLQTLGLNSCFICNQMINSSADMLISHQVDWYYSKTPAQLYFDPANAGYIHRSCLIRDKPKTKVWGSSPYKGVSLIRKSGRFKAEATVQKQVHHFGSFNTAREAAEIYDQEIVKLRPKAITNHSLGLI
jgi:hypothetical protein